MQNRKLSSLEVREKAVLESRFRSEWGRSKNREEEWLKARQQARLALVALRESNLWQATHPRAWEKYCQEVLDLHPRQARFLIAAAEVVQDLEEHFGTTVPISDGAARELEPYSREDRINAYTQATANGNAPTANRLAQAMAHLQAGKASEDDLSVINAADKELRKEKPGKQTERKTRKEFHDLIETLIGKIENATTKRFSGEKKRLQWWHSWLETGRQELSRMGS